MGVKESTPKKAAEPKRKFHKALPNAAMSHSLAQPRWPIHAGHCHTRIFHDSTVAVVSHSAPETTGTPALLTKIANAHSTTPFQKRVLSALLQVPTGQFTTYRILAAYLQSSARAVGTALRNNPFAPEVPCHRVLASGGGIGGFKGSWGKNGKAGLNDGEKRALLRKEGVKFDGSGRVVGRPWERFR